MKKELRHTPRLRCTLPDSWEEKPLGTVWAWGPCADTWEYHCKDGCRGDSRPELGEWGWGGVTGQFSHAGLKGVGERNAYLSFSSNLLSVVFQSLSHL